MLDNHSASDISSHCSHKLQPLDVSCYGPFKTYYNKSVDQWMLNNPGVPLNMYNISEILVMSFPSAFTPSNNIKGFERAGIEKFLTLAIFILVCL